MALPGALAALLAAARRAVLAPMGPVTTRAIPIVRGALALLDGDDPWPRTYEPLPCDAWLTHEAPAPAVDAVPRRVGVRSVCQTASGGSWVAILGATWTPDALGRFRLRVPSLAADAPRAGLRRGELAEAVLARAVEALATWPVLASGALSLDRGFVHEVDLKPWAWRAAAAVAVELLAPEVFARPDDALAALANERFAAEPRAWRRER